ncbi:unnamed protein product [Leptidea sinapis]|uniref:C2H2-type domain-containing protein n=1 Tax=Leptidea sinapis TaxID=189913 RepID=A0A5E4R7S1_9NEOP|nr:unnamed protein product [Leptidea sinapis]
MADYDIIPSCDEDELFKEKTDEVTDLHAYYMSQFNLELENGKSKPKNDSFKFGTEESFDFEVLDSWTTTETAKTDFEIIDKVLDSNVSDQNIKEVLLDLDNIEFDVNFKMAYDNKVKTDVSHETNDYIDDESLLDELCREDESCHLSPDAFNEECFNIPNDTQLPSIETAFSKRYCNYANEDIVTQSVLHNTEVPDTNQTITSVEQYSYPNNILYNFDNEKSYILPDTPTSCSEFSFERNERKPSVSESIESSSYYDDNSETFDEDELFINLDDFGLQLETDNGFVRFDECVTAKQSEIEEKSKSQGERVCLWEQCYERYPNQNTLVEHIERSHVNTCLWRDCARGRRPFNARYKLLIHMRVHSGHKPNRCHHPGCGKAFSRLENLKIHVRSHTGERPYACPAPHCRKAFSNSSDRAKHQRTHFNADFELQN